MHGSKADKSVCVGVITGINLGIGLAYARLGANVAICGRRQDRLDAAVASLSAEGAGSKCGAVGNLLR